MPDFSAVTVGVESLGLARQGTSEKNYYHWVAKSLSNQIFRVCIKMCSGQTMVDFPTNGMVIATFRSSFRGVLV
jgi:hypothetical protein